MQHMFTFRYVEMSMSLCSPQNVIPYLQNRMISKAGLEIDDDTDTANRKVFKAMKAAKDLSLKTIDASMASTMEMLLAARERTQKEYALADEKALCPVSYTK